ncbi:MAG: class I SAM-dependent methyltransferase [Lachnospiraceae bacterium]|nr:class I SAM-dependent methyltransferase [Lachnospiraceae bacterium]
MDISKRLKMIANQIRGCECLADIGTDHAYLPIYLLKEKKIKKAIACDINPGPLKKAEENVTCYGFLKDISLRLSDGLRGLSAGEADAAVIAGMGGFLIIDILKASPEVAKSFKKLILQPQLNIDKVRRYIHLMGFSIENEDMIFEDGKYYTVINAVPGAESYGEPDYLFGRKLIENKNQVFKNYAVQKLDKNNKIIETLLKNGKEKPGERMSEIEYENKILKEVLSCL